MLKNAFMYEVLTEISVCVSGNISRVLAWAFVEILAELFGEELAEVLV